MVELGEKFITPGAWSVEFDEDGTIVSAFYSDSYRALLGFESEEEYANANESWSDALHPDDVKRVAAHEAEVYAAHPQGMDFDIEYRMMTKSGYRWFHDHGYVTRREDGSAIRCDGVVFDIEAAMQEESLANRRMLLDYFVDQYWSACFIDLEKDTLDVVRADNANISEYIMDGTEEDMWKFIADRFHPDDIPLMMQITSKDFVREELKDKASISYTAREIIDGEERTFRIHIIRGADVNHVAVGFMDITAEVEEEERKARERLQEEQRINTENSVRLFALEDDLESIYDVELESGRYEVFVKGDFYQSNVVDKLLEPTDYFEDLRANIDAVIHPEDRDGLYDVLTRESIRSELAAADRFDYYYRIMAEDGPLWFKMRVVYKDATKRNVIIGAFNAEGEVGARQIAEQKSQLEQQLLRNDIIHDIIHSGKWSFFLDADDRVVGTDYSEDVQRVIGNDLSPKADSWSNILHPDDRERTLAAFNAAIADHTCQTPYDVNYRMVDRNGEYHWFHSAGRVMREADGTGEFFGVHMDITKQIEEQQERLRAQEEMEIHRAREIELMHAEFRASALAYLAEHEGDITAYLNFFAGRLRELIGCDQVIYRDTDGIQVVNNAPELGEDYELDAQVCRECPFFGIQSPVYADGAIEMIDNRAGFAGVSVHEDCPVKSTLTRLAYLDGEVKGYLTIHYITSRHEFTDYERRTLDEFTNLLSLSLSRHKGRMESARLERDLAGKQRQLRAFGDMINAATWSIDIEGDDQIVGIAWSNELRRMFGFEETLEDFPNELEAWSDLLHPDDREPVLECFWKSVRTRDEALVYDVSYRVRRKSGEYRWYRALGRIEAASGDARRLFGIVVDIFAEKMLEQQKEQLERDMRMIGGVASGYNALYYINIDEDVLHIYALDEAKYPGSRAIFEADEPDFYKIIGGYGLSEQVHPDDRHLFADFGPDWFREVLAGRKKYSMRFRAATQDGYRWDEMELTKYEDIDEQANVVAVGFTDRDADIRKEQEYQQQLERARETADAANKSKSDFLFSMSHDIRTPMNAITGFTAMAKKYASDEQAVIGYLDKIDMSGKQLLSLVNQVLEMARIESGQTELDERPVNVQREFDVMATVLSEQAQVNGLSLTCSLLDVEHFDVFADEARMNSITLNIMGNAMKYTPEGGSIDFILREVPARKPGRATFVFTVADTGIGMSEEFLEVLFEPFAREQSSTISKIQGTGLGLPIVKSLVDLLGGDIEVHSELGRGTRFDITVDFRINEDADVAAEEPTIELLASFKGLRVLLVEDNELNREIALDILDEEGLLAEEAEDGSQAVEMLRQKGPDYYDFVLMDIQMPVMDGYEATRAIRGMYPDAHLPIIALSANAFAEDKARSLDAGMDDHVAKPIDIGELFAALARFL